MTLHCTLTCCAIQLCGYTSKIQCDKLDPLTSLCSGDDWYYVVQNPLMAENPREKIACCKKQKWFARKSGSFTEDRNDLHTKVSFWVQQENQKSSLRVSNTKSYASCRGFLTAKCLDPWLFFINFIGFIACFTSLGPPCESPILDFLKESMFFEGHNGPWCSGVGQLITATGRNKNFAYQERCSSCLFPRAPLWMKAADPCCWKLPVWYPLRGPAMGVLEFF